MKKSSHQEARNYPKAVQGDGFIIIFEADYWLAHDPDDHVSGLILYNKLTRKYHARVSDIHMIFPKFAKAPFKSAEDCPVDGNHNPKADFLMLLALRQRFKEPIPGSDFVARSWRHLAMGKRLQEIEDLTAKPFSEKSKAMLLGIADSKSKFEKYAGDRLACLIRDDHASDNLIRLGKWLRYADEIESEKIPQNYSRFFAAVEEATPNAEHMVPCQKDVQEIFERDLSINQQGRGHVFRDLMRQLHFHWLPAGGRGIEKHQKKSGIRRKN